MTISDRPGSYGDCYTAMDKALEDTQGVRVQMKDFDAATFFRMRLHTARSIDRKRNCEIYNPGDPGYNSSAYDSLVVRIRTERDIVWVYIQQVAAGLGKMEVLSEVGEWEALPTPVVEQPSIEPPPAPLMIEHFKRRF